MELRKQIGLNIKKHRLKHGLTQASLSKQMGINLKSCVNHERGMHLSIRALENYASEFNTTVKQLFEE